MAVVKAEFNGAARSRFIPYLDFSTEIVCIIALEYY